MKIDGSQGIGRADWNAGAFIEEWWGEQLSSELATRIENSPGKHIQRFLEAYEDLRFDPPPELPFGQLRAESRLTLMQMRGSRGKPAPPLTLAAWLLLYSHEVIVEDPFALGYEAGPAQLSRAVRKVAPFRPLIMSGVLRFAVLGSRARHPSSHWHPGRDALWDEITAAHPSDLTDAAEGLRVEGEDVSDVLRDALSDVIGSLGLARNWDSRITPVMRGHLELIMLERLMQSKAERSDLRLANLNKLASITAPVLSAPAREIVTMRESDELFHAWRNALELGLRNVGEIPFGRDEAWQSTASEILIDQLAPLRSQMNKSIRKSSILSSLTTGFRPIAFTGVGAVTAGALSGANPLVGIAGAAAGKATETAVSYLSGLKERRRDKAVLSIILALEDPSTSAPKD